MTGLPSAALVEQAKRELDALAPDQVLELIQEAMTRPRASAIANSSSTTSSSAVASVGVSATAVSFTFATDGATVTVTEAPALRTVLPILKDLGVELAKAVAVDSLKDLVRDALKKYGAPVAMATNMSGHQPTLPPADALAPLRRPAIVDEREAPRPPELPSAADPFATIKKI